MASSGKATFVNPAKFDFVETIINRHYELFFESCSKIYGPFNLFKTKTTYKTYMTVVMMTLKKCCSPRALLPIFNTWLIDV